MNTSSLSPNKNITTEGSKKVLNISYLTALSQLNLNHFKINSKFV